jgi:hypothetical protein
MAQPKPPADLPPLQDAQAVAIGDTVAMTLHVSSGALQPHVVRMSASIDAAATLHAQLGVALGLARMAARMR